jgi:hypothetical protein
MLYTTENAVLLSGLCSAALTQARRSQYSESSGHLMFRHLFRYGGIFITLVCESIWKDFLRGSGVIFLTLAIPFTFQHSISIEPYTFGPYATEDSCQCPGLAGLVVTSFGNGRKFTLLHHRGR